MNRRLQAGVLSALVALTACGSAEGESTASSAEAATSTMAPLVSATAPDSVAASIASTAVMSELVEFCRLAQATDDELPESFIGSTEHVEMVDALATAAPSEVRPHLETYRNYLSSGAIDHAYPETKDTENWPDEIRSATADAQAFISSNC